MKTKLLPILLILAIIIVSSCSSGEGQALDSTQEKVSEGEGDQEIPSELVLMSHDSFAISEAVLEQFEQEHGVKIILLPAGDTGAALNQAILAKNDPVADVFFGVDNTFMSRALEEEIFVPYESPVLAQIDDSLEQDDSYRLLPVDFGDVCLNYDIDWFASRDVDPPDQLKELLLPTYESLVVVENPATSSPGLAFLLATISEFGTEGDFTYLDFWREMRANGILVTDGWEEAYFGQFSAAGTGDRPIVVSYASSPPAEMIFAEPPLDEPPTASITAPGTCFRQIEFVGILKGSSNLELAQKFIDFMLSENFQADIPLNMFVFPSNVNVELPEVFVDWAKIPEEPATVSPDEIEANRELWVESWTETVLR